MGFDSDLNNVELKCSALVGESTKDQHKRIIDKYTDLFTNNDFNNRANELRGLLRSLWEVLRKMYKSAETKETKPFKAIYDKFDSERTKLRDIILSKHIYFEEQTYDKPIRISFKEGRYWIQSVPYNEIPDFSRDRIVDICLNSIDCSYAANNNFVDLISIENHIRSGIDRGINVIRDVYETQLNEMREAINNPLKLAMILKPDDPTKANKPPAYEDDEVSK